MVEHKTEMTGKAMAVIVGVICLIAPWFSQIGTFPKIMISILGIILIFLGTK